MKITIDIPEDKKTALINAFANRYGYQAKIDDENGETIDNPTTKGQFALNIIKSFVKDIYISDKVSEIEATKKATATTAESEIDVISVS